jgi:hypothetical protein
MHSPIALLLFLQKLTVGLEAIEDELLYTH